MNSNHETNANSTKYMINGVQYYKPLKLSPIEALKRIPRLLLS
jgi:hypothetical protein